MTIPGHTITAGPNGYTCSCGSELDTVPAAYQHLAAAVGNRENAATIARRDHTAHIIAAALRANITTALTGAKGFRPHPIPDTRIDALAHTIATALDQQER